MGHSRLDTHRSAHGHHQVLDYGQPQTGSAKLSGTTGSYPVETLKDSLPVVKSYFI